MYNKKALRRFLPGGINDGGGWDFPSGSFKPYELGTGFGIGIGSSSSGTYPYSQQAKQDEIFAAGMGLGPAPSSIPKSTEFKSDNPFEYITKTGLGSWSETRDGTTVDANGNPFQNWTPPQKEETPEEESDLVIQEKRAKRLGAFGGEEFVNVKNNVLFKPALGIANNIATNKLQFQNAYDESAVEKAVGTTNEIDEGDWHMTGSFAGNFRRPGQDRNSRATFGNFAGDQQMSKYGGFMKEGGSSGYTIGQEVEMTPKQLEDFLRAGGEVDYI